MVDIGRALLRVPWCQRVSYAARTPSSTCAGCPRCSIRVRATDWAASSRCAGGPARRRRTVHDEIVVDATDDPGELPSRPAAGRSVAAPVRLPGAEPPTDDRRRSRRRHQARLRDRARGTVLGSGATRHSGEWLFVPSPAGHGEDEGWLMAYVHDEATGVFGVRGARRDRHRRRTRRVDPAAQRVPYGFHAAWFPA